MSDTIFFCFSGSYALLRRPLTPGQPLFAWDAADEYLLEMFAENPAPGEKVLVANDSFGALAVGLHASRPHAWGDSLVSKLATADNLVRNGLTEDAVTFAPSTAPPPGEFYDAVLWRVPKSVAQFQEQIALLAPKLREDSMVLVGGMDKHLPPQTRALLEQLGRVDTLHGKKKARVFRVTPDSSLPAPPLPAEIALKVPGHGLTLTGGPNVFARETLDPGASFFLSVFSQLPDAHRIADLGCGNGVLGLVAKKLRPDAELHLFDESYQAVASAEANAERNGLGGGAKFHLADGLSGYESEPFDLILCNPPFHQGHAVGDQIAWQMVTESKKRLRSGGTLWVVGNRHLNYHVTLKRVFGNCQQLASNPQFVVLSAQG